MPAAIRAAVTLVGRKAIAQLALEAATFRFFQAAPGNGGRSIGHLHLHAAAVAACAQAIAERTGAAVDVAHLGGLLHDVGKLVMPLAFGTATLDAIAAEHAGRRAARGAERKRLGVDHAAAGALVARASQVETPVEIAIAFHHGGLDGLTIPSREAACVIIADEIVGLASRPEPDYTLLGPALGDARRCATRTSTTSRSRPSAAARPARRWPPASPSSSARRGSTT